MWKKKDMAKHAGTMRFILTVVCLLVGWEIADKIIQRITSSTDSIGRKRVEALAEDSNPILVLFSFR